VSDLEKRLKALHEEWESLEQEMRKAGITIKELLSDPACMLIKDNGAEARVQEDELEFTVLSEDECPLATGFPEDRCGAYMIQCQGASSENCPLNQYKAVRVRKL
jgi:hypothetical protein